MTKEIIRCANFKCRVPLLEFDKGEQVSKDEIVFTALQDTIHLITIDTIECPKCGDVRDLQKAIELLGRY